MRGILFFSTLIVMELLLFSYMRLPKPSPYFIVFILTGYVAAYCCIYDFLFRTGAIICLIASLIACAIAWIAVNVVIPIF